MAVERKPLAPPSWRRQHGDAAEQHGCDWLCRRGLRLVARNWRCRLGEIDLIMQHGDTLVFVEVRLRRDHDYGGALASVTVAKQRKLLRAAKLFLAQRPQFGQHACRFDVLALSGNRSTPEWVQNAFYGDE